MNDIIQAMINRRSIRKYKPVMIPQHTIDEIINAASRVDFSLPINFG